ncbi:MAG: amino acid ABC transporter permease [Nocardioides sp.]
MDVIVDNAGLIAVAFATTLMLFLVSAIFSLLLGTLLAAMRVGPVAILRRATATYVTVVRNTPLILIFIFFRFAGPKIGIQFNWVDVVWGDVRMTAFFAAGAVSLILYTSAFVCEALRSGVNAVPLGQAEAARAIGLTFGAAMTNVILPQSFRAALPPMASVQIAMLKNTTVMGTFGVLEAFFRMRLLLNDNATARYWIFAAFAVVFVVLVEILSFAANRLERRWRIA